MTFIIVARILGKAGFGEWGILRVTVAGFQTLAGFGMGATATKYIAQFRGPDVKRAGRVLAVTGFATLATASAAALLLVMLAPWLAARALGAPHLAGELRICGALLFLSGVQAWQFGALAGFEAFKAATKVELWSGVASFLLTVAGALYAGLIGALWGMLASWTLRSLFAHHALRAQAARAGVRPVIDGGLAELKLLWSFSLPEFLAAAVVGPTLWFVQALLVNQSDGYRAMGEFAAVHQWRMALSTLPTLLCAGYLPVAAALGRSDPARTRRMMVGVAGICGGVTLAAILPLALLSGPILAAYGKGFASATPAFLAILGLAFVDSVNAATFNALLAAGRMWQRLGANACWAGVLVLSSWLLVPHHGAVGLALAMLVAQALHLMVQIPLAFGALPRRVPERAPMHAPTRRTWGRPRGWRLQMRVLQKLRQGVAASSAGRILKRLGLAKPALRFYERTLLRRGQYVCAHEGRALTFGVRDRDEISTLDSFLQMERRLVSRILGSIRAGDAVFDIGANIGIMSILVAASKQHLGIHVHAFEPNPQTARRAQVNATVNHCDNLTVHTLALGRDTGEARLYVLDGDCGRDSMIEGREGCTAVVDIQVERGDEVSHRLGLHPSVVKIDVEGAEMDVLLGMEHLFRNQIVRDLFLEVHPPRLEKAGYSEAELAGWLESRGYHRLWQEPRGGQTHQHFQRAGT